MNLGNWRVEGAQTAFGDARLDLPQNILDAIKDEAKNELTIGMRPEAFDVLPQAEPHSIPLKVTFVEGLGSDAYVYGTIVGHTDETQRFGSGDSSDTMVVRIPPENVPSANDVVYLRPRADRIHYFSAVTGNRIGD